MGKRTSPSKKAQYNAYLSENRYEKNRRRRIARHIKNNPNDGVASTAIMMIRYRRKKPLSKCVDKSTKYILKYFKVVEGERHMYKRTRVRFSLGETATLR